MYSSVSKLDRDIARSFLNAPSNIVSYTSIPMRNKPKVPSQSVCNKENLFDDILRQPHPKNTNLIPMYYDVIVDTVTDYDIFYPIAKQTEKYYPRSVSNETSTYPHSHVQRLDELAVSIDFPYDYDSISDQSDPPVQNQHERLHPIKNVRFNDNPTWIPHSRNHIENTSIPLDQYYFYPEAISPMNNEQSSVRYITTPFFWFRPVVDHNYAICIPASRPSLHAYVTSSFDPNSTPNPIRL